MIKRLRFSVPEVSPLLARLASVVPTEFVVVELLLSLERSERTEEEDDEELVPELEDQMSLVSCMFLDNKECCHHSTRHLMMIGENYGSDGSYDCDALQCRMELRC
jgi:predicted nucleic acid-binding protein